MLYDGRAFLGTIGGGQAELWAMRDGLQFLHQQIPNPNALLTQNAKTIEAVIHSITQKTIQRDYILGGDGKQCCGGRIWVEFAIMHPKMAMKYHHESLMRPQRILIIGAGHVGRELAKLCINGHWGFDWVDERPLYRQQAQNIIPQKPKYIAKYYNILAQLPTQTPKKYDYAMIMAHNHELDSQYCAQLMQNGMVSHKILMLGSLAKSQKISFTLRQTLGNVWDQMGHLYECPIGSINHGDKSPFAVAIAVLHRLIILINEDKNAE